MSEILKCCDFFPDIKIMLIPNTSVIEDDFSVVISGNGNIINSYTLRIGNLFSEVNYSSSIFVKFLTLQDV